MADFDSAQPVRTTTVPLDENLKQVGGSAITLGQKASAASLPVVIASDQSTINVSTVTPSKTVNYNTASAVASAAASTHSFTPAGSIKVHRVIVSASGELKAEIQYGPTGSEVSQAVVFTSAASKIGVVELGGVPLDNTKSIKVIRTNEDLSAMDVYSSIVYE